MTILKRLEEVLSSAQLLLKDDTYLDGEQALSLLERYLELLESWQDEYKVARDQNLLMGEDEKTILKSQLNILEKNHSEIMKKASGLLDSVKGEIGRVNKSSTAIKKYISNPVVNTRPTIRKG